jgi:hypothetical protein
MKYKSQNLFKTTKYNPNSLISKKISWTKEVKFFKSINKLII